MQCPQLELSYYLLSHVFFVRFLQKKKQTTQFQSSVPRMGVCFRTKVKKGTGVSACGIPPHQKPALHQRDQHAGPFVSALPQTDDTRHATIRSSKLQQCSAQV